MSGLFGSSKKKTSTAATSTSSGERDPYAPTVPLIQGLLDALDTQAYSGETESQTGAFNYLESFANAGHPYAGQINTDTANLFAGGNRSGAIDAATGTLQGQIGALASGQTTGNAYADLLSRIGEQANGGTSGAAYSALQSALGGFANGKTIDVGADPAIQSLLKTVGDDVATRVNSMFAGAGRDLSGKNQEAVARGVAGATAPILLDEAARRQMAQQSAAQTLFSGALSSDQSARSAAESLFGAELTGAQAQQGAAQNLFASTVGGAQAAQGLDYNAAAGNIEAANSAVDASLLGPNQILALQQQRKQLPMEDLALIASILFPAASLGEQQSGTSSSTGNSSEKGSSFSLGFSLSDEREKTDIEPVTKDEANRIVYRFRYKDDPTRRIHMGYIAQEVEREQPEAVASMGGRKFVEYEKATQPSVDAMRRKNGGRS